MRDAPSDPCGAVAKGFYAKLPCARGNRRVLGAEMKGTIIIGFAIAFTGLLALGIFGASKSPTKEAEANLAFYDWDETLRSKSGWASPNHWANSVIFVRVAWWRNSSRARTFEYLTGGRAGIADPDALASARLARVPDRLLANHQEEKVLVRFWSNDHTAEQAEELALRTARTMHLATTQVWPQEPIPVQVDVYSMPEGAAYSFAKRVRWKRGRPLELAIFLTGAANAENRTQVAAHELYHLLAAFRRIGRWKTDETVYLNTQIGFEEVAATSFASCGALLTDGHLSRPVRDLRVVIDGVPYKPPLSTNEVKQVLAALRLADARSLTGLGSTIGALIDSTPFFHLLGPAQNRIELGSPQGEKFLEMCQEFLSDPVKIEHWLEKLGQDDAASGD